MIINKKNLSLVHDFLRRDLKTQFAGSVLGLGWLFLGPLLQVALYAVVFGLVFKTRPMVGNTEVPYLVYLCSALIPWSIFSNTIARLCNTFLEHSQYIRKLSVPKWVFIAYVSLSSCVQFCFLFALFLMITLLFKVQLSVLGLLSYVLIFIIGQAIATGIGLILATLTVFVRDVSQFIGIGLQLMFWGLPICYPENLIPPAMKQMVMFHPLWSTIVGLHNSIFNPGVAILNKVPHAVAALLVIWAVALILYKKLSPWVVDEL